MVSTYLIDQLLEMWLIGVHSIEIRVQGEFGQRLPWWLEALHFDLIHAQRTVVPHRAWRNHWYTLHAAVAHFPTVL